MNKNFQIGLILSATDRMTSVINRSFGNANKQLTGFQKKTAAISRGAAGVSLAAGATAAAVLTPIGLAVDKAIEFEDTMASVGKVLNLKNGSKALEAVGNQVKDTSVYLAQMPNDVARMYANLSQGGVAKNNLSEIARLAGEVAVAFDISADVAGDRYVKMQNALGTSAKQTKSVFDAINKISDSTAAKASQITDYLASGGAGVARALNITGQQSAALGSVFISMGKSGEEAATIFERMTKGMLNMDRATGKVYASAGGGIAGLMAVVEKGSKLKGVERFKYFRNFGEYGNDVSQLSNNFGLLQKHLALVANEESYANSVNKEFTNRMGTTATKLRQTKAQMETLAIEAGTGLLPAIKELLVVVTPMLKRISVWIAANPKLTAQIMKGAVAFGVIAAAVSVFSGLLSGIAAIAGAASTALGILRSGILLARGAMLALSSATLTNPILLVIAAVAAGAYLIYKNWEPIKTFFTGMWQHVTFVFNDILNTIKGLGKNMYDAGANIFKELARGLMSAALLPFKPIIWAVNKIRGYFPQSPAKYGALKDLHKTDIMGQVARGVNPAPLQMAINSGLDVAVNKPLASPVPNATATPGGGSTSINFAPVINFSGTGTGETTKENIVAALKQYEGDLMRLVSEAMRKEARAAY